MKRITVIILSLCIALSLCACGSSDARPSEPIESPVSTAEPEPTAEPTAAPAAPELVSLLDEIRDGCFPGTAGCSLTSTAFAARLLDWNAASGNADTASASAKKFANSLTADQAELFPDQISLVYAAAQQLATDSADELLSECGYEAKSGPWTQDTVSALFDAIYDGLGMDIPE